MDTEKESVIKTILMMFFKVIRRILALFLLVVLCACVTPINIVLLVIGAVTFISVGKFITGYLLKRMVLRISKTVNLVAGEKTEHIEA